MIHHMDRDNTISEQNGANKRDFKLITFSKEYSRISSMSQRRDHTTFFFQRKAIFTKTMQQQHERNNRCTIRMPKTSIGCHLTLIIQQQAILLIYLDCSTAIFILHFANIITHLHRLKSTVGHYCHTVNVHASVRARE
jgi:hypothetical protein